MNRAIKWTSLAFTLTAAIGCQPPVKPQPKAAAAGFVLPPSREAATAVLVPQVKQFSDDISAFPGSTGADHRQTMVIALEDLSRILRLINGPYESPGFTNSLATIAAAENTASNQSIPRGRMEAVENQALQAVNFALKDISTRYLLDKDQLPGLLDALSTKIAAAAPVQGPMHDLDATDAFEAVRAVVQQMTDDLQSMVPEPPPTPVTPPPAPPVAPEVPATTPATAPATAPATMPTPTPTPTPTP